MNHRTGTTLSIRPVEVAKNLNPQKVSEYFGVNTFSEVTMKKMVPLPTFKSFKKWQEGGAVIGMKEAEGVGDRERGDLLYPLVSAHDRIDSRET